MKSTPLNIYEYSLLKKMIALKVLMVICVADLTDAIMKRGLTSPAAYLGTPTQTELPEHLGICSAILRQSTRR